MKYNIKKIMLIIFLLQFYIIISDNEKNKGVWEHVEAKEREKNGWNGNYYNF